MSRTINVSVTRPDPSPAAPSGQPFAELALAIAKSPTAGDLRRTLEGSQSIELRNLIQKADPLALSDGDFGTTDARLLSQHFVASISDDDVIGQLIAQGARSIPPNLTRALIGLGTSADLTATESSPKVVIDNLVGLVDAPEYKAAGIVVLSEELASAANAVEILERELRVAVLKASNDSALTALAITPTALGADPVASLLAALAAAESSTGYVIVGPPGVIAAVSASGHFRSSARVSLVPAESATAWTVIPASRVAIADSGLSVRSARHASVDLAGADNPAFSLWQRNSVGLLSERRFRVAYEAAS